MRSKGGGGGCVFLYSGHFVLLFILALTTSSVNCHIKLNLPRIRLPYSEVHSVNVTLRVQSTNGCYKWSVTRPDLLNIIPVMKQTEENGVINTECSNEAIVSTIPKGNQMLSSSLPINSVVRVESFTQEVVRCDVTIDKLASFTIQTSTKELFLEEAPSKISVQGFGIRGELFDTLEGIPFTWWVESGGHSSEGTNAATEILRFIPFSESMYQASSGIAALESDRKQGSTILVEGLKPGSARVVSKILDPIYKNLTTGDMKIFIVANLLLQPSEAVVVPQSKFKLKLLQIKQGKPVEISLPSKDYEFQISNETVATYDHKTATITSLALGDTKITVVDKNFVIEKDEVDPPGGPSVYLSVRNPKSLSLSVYPHRNWNVMIGEEYEIVVDIYDSQNLKILVTDNIKVKTKFSNDLFKSNKTSTNGTWHFGIPSKPGTTKITAELPELLKLNGEAMKLTQIPQVKAEMEIYQRVVINPKEKILPWDPIVKPKYDLRLTPSGGTGNFYWSTTNSSIASISQNGAGKTEGKGFANITASMTINQNNRGISRVYILPAISMEIVNHIVEAEVGTHILVPLSFYTIRPDDPERKKVPYSYCRDLPFVVEIDNPSFIYDNVTYYPATKPACTMLPILSNELGSSIVKVQYQIDDQVFHASVLVSTFQPLKVSEPKSLETVLAVGSSRKLVFEGGPRPMKNEGFYRHFFITNETVVRQSEIKVLKESHEDIYIYEILCTEIGQTEVGLAIGNEAPTEDRPGVSRRAIISVFCAEPAKLYFRVESSSSKCPTDLSGADTKIAIPNYENSNVLATVKDSKGRQFDNITSLLIDWTMSKSSLIEFKTPKWAKTEGIIIERYGSISIPGKHIQTLIPNGETGDVTISAQIVGYRNDLLNRNQIKYFNLEKPAPDREEDYLESMKHSMDLSLVSDLICEPTSPVSIFNHPSSKVIVKIYQGSGYFDIKLRKSGNPIIDMKYHDVNKTLELTPIKEGSSQLIIQDLCLSGGKISRDLIVNVNGIALIDVEIKSDKIPVGGESLLYVKLMDNNGYPLSSDILSIVNLKIDLGTTTSTIQLVEKEQGIHTQEGSIYSVKGQNVGVASITFLAEVGQGKIIKSTPLRVTIFSPLTLKPRNLTMLIGSYYQLLALGGPQPDTFTSFKVGIGRDDENIVSILPNGLIQGKAIGETEIFGSCSDRTLDKPIIYSEDSMIIKVVPLLGVQIHSPLKRIQVGEEMPIWCQGFGDGLEPTVLLGGLKSLMTFQWDLLNHEVGNIQNSFEENGVFLKSGDKISINFKARQVGRVSVSLNVNYKQQIFKDEIEIEVFDAPRFLKYPTKTFTDFLMTTNSELDLKANYPLTTYSIEEFHSSDQSIVTVNGYGVVHSGDQLGRVIIFVTIRDEITGNVETFGFNIQVEPLSYLMIHTSLPIYFTDKKEILPRSLSFNFQVTCHDNVGRKFDSINSNLKVRPNRFDSIQVNNGMDNNTFQISGSSEGRTAVKVYDSRNPHIYAFLIVPIGEIIEPKLQLGSMTVGDIVSFSCDVKNIENQEGYWSSSSPDILYVEPKTGYAIGLSQGKVKLEYMLANVGVVSSIEITILGLTQVIFTPGLKSTSITNGKSTKIFEYPISFNDKITNTLLGKNCLKEEVDKFSHLTPFTCDIQLLNESSTNPIDKLFKVKPIFNFKTGKYACQVEVVEFESSQNFFYGSTILSDISLSVKINYSALDFKFRDMQYDDVKSTKLILQFNPSVYIHNKDVEINNLKSNGYVIISGLVRILNKISVVTSDKVVEDAGIQSAPLMGSTLTLDKYEHLKSPANVESRAYRFRVLPNFWTDGNMNDLNITFISRETDQEFIVPIKIKFVSSIGYDVSRSEEGYLWTCIRFLTYLFGLLIFAWIVQLIYKWNTQGAPSSNQTLFVSIPRDQLTLSPNRQGQVADISLRAFGNRSVGDDDNDDGLHNFYSTPSRLFTTEDGFYPGSGGDNLRNRNNPRNSPSYSRMRN